MVKLTKDITGCSGGEVYPRTYAKDEDCPSDLLEAAMELGAVEKKGAAKAAEAAAKAAEAETARQAEEEANRLAEEEAAELAAQGGRA